jgi:hypothetical protein
MASETALAIPSTTPPRFHTASTQSGRTEKSLHEMVARRLGSVKDMRAEEGIEMK